MTTTSPTGGSTTPQQPAGLLTASDQTTQDAIGLASNFNSFLQLLTTQLKNQDPLAPMDATQFTTQLVQFSQVEQSINTNSRLDQLVKLQSGSQAMSAVGFMGQEVQAFGDKTVLKDGNARFVYTLPSDAGSLTVTIKNANGDVIRTISNAPKDQGDHVVAWDGKDDQGNPMVNGTYTFSVSAKDAKDQAIDAVTGVIGTVQGVTVDNGTVVLDLGNDLHAKVTDIFTVNEPQTASSN
jgi:flagellar basal-body rod modification protein FlgD